MTVDTQQYCADCGVNWTKPYAEFCAECIEHHSHERFRVMITISEGSQSGKTGYVINESGAYTCNKPSLSNAHTRESAVAIVEALRNEEPSIKLEMC